ncbi:hypothetical protein B0T14DRAFT_566448 [Immersiella caudata]|uniref:Uncharacterized protein n=1 Tax=Immersiella caudata TaxID=314043 RepID=A0AA39WQB5_9PEZI|nr:hypothetical protein B0T14DRAFT_566448 [Immersiella caudata]
MSHAEYREESTHYRSRSPKRHSSRHGTDHDHRRSRPEAGVSDMSEYVTRRLIPAVMDRSERPIKVVVNFGDMKIDDADDTTGGMSPPPTAPNAIIFNAPGSTLEMSGSASSANLVDSRALRQRITRGRGPLTYSTLPLTGVRGRALTDGPYKASYVTEYDRGGLDVPLPRTERLLSFDRGGARLGWSMGACGICEMRNLVNRRGHCEQCDVRWLSLRARKDRYEVERDREYSTIRTPMWIDDLSDVSYTPGNGGVRYGRSWSARRAGYDYDRH